MKSGDTLCIQYGQDSTVIGKYIKSGRG